MSATPVSVVIVSRDRPDDLRKCLRALEFQTYRPFEVVVVGDTAPPDRAPAKYVPFDMPNISAARNLGIEQAAGDIVAFIDDDAVAEPTWLARLIAPFDRADVAASGGFVRGRNGISHQWTAQAIDRDGQSHALAVENTKVFDADPSRVIKVQGTNCAFRRESLIAMGGFDESFRFYLDEADLCMRLAQTGGAVAVVPGAEVQHGFSASMFRGRDRRPTSLFEIAASQAIFQTKHASSARIEPFLAHQEARLGFGLQSGTLEPRDVRRLRREIKKGYEEGLARSPRYRKAWAAPGDFTLFVDGPVQEHQFLVTPRSGNRTSYQDARDLAASGQAVTLMDFSLTSLFHRRGFHADGFWVQSGGIFGKSNRSDPIFAWYSKAERLRREIAQLRKTR